MRGVPAPIGSVAIHNGHVFKKTSHARHWSRVSHLNWEEANGPIPSGYALTCRDGDVLNVDPSNWLRVPGFLSTYAWRAIREAPPELREAVILNETVKHQLRAARAKAGLHDPIAERVRRAIEVRRLERHHKKMEEDPAYREQYRQKVRRRHLTQTQNRAIRMAADPDYAAARRETLRRQDKRRRDRMKGATT